MNSEVRIVAPAGEAHTNGVLEVRLEVAGNVPDRLELLRDGEVLAVLEPPYVYAWDTTVEAEGEHTLRTRTVFGETVFEGESREVVVDRTPPRLVTRTPEPGAQMVWVKAPIQAEFSEPMRVDTVTSTTVRLTVGDSEVSRTVGLSGDGKTLTVSPGEGYAPSNPVRLVLTESVVDLAGNSLVPESRGWDWVVPFWIPWGTGDGARTSFSSAETMGSYAFDSTGNLIATWHDTRSSYSYLRVRRFANGEWIDYGSSGVASSTISGISKASLILNSEGHPIVAWMQEHNQSPYSARIHASQWTGTNWSPMGISSIEEDDAKIYKTAPYLTWTASGRPAITWAERDASGNSTICAAEWSAGNWYIQGACFNIQEQTKEAYYPPILKYASNNIPTMAWIAKNPFNIYAVHAGQLHNDVWEPLFQEDLEILNQDPYVSLAIGPSDTPILSWLYTAGDGHEAVTTSRWHDSAWTLLGPATMPLSGDLTMMAPALQTDASGTPFIAWTGHSSPKHRLHAARWTGQQWESLDDSSLANDGAPLTSFHSLQSMKLGEIILSWQESTGTGTRMRVRRFNR